MSKKRVLTVWSFHKRGLWFDFFCWRRGHFSRCEKGSCFWSGWCGGRFDWRSIFCMICPWRIRNWTAGVLRLLTTTAIFCQTGTGYGSRISCCISGGLIGIWMAGYYCGGLSCCSSLSNWRGRICRFIMDRFERGSNWNKKKKYMYYNGKIFVTSIIVLQFHTSFNRDVFSGWSRWALAPDIVSQMIGYKNL